MESGFHIDIPENEKNKELFETSIDWEKEEYELKEKEKHPKE